MTNGQIVLLGLSFILSIINLIFLIVSFKVDGETDEEYREKFCIIYNNLKDYRLHKEKVENVLKLDKEE